MAEYLRLLDTATAGNRYDVTPIFSNPVAFSAMIEDLFRDFNATEFDIVAGIDALGFILGTAAALRFQKAFLPIRKGGKLPVEVSRRELVDYDGESKSLEIRADALRSGQRVLLVDEWIETGAQVKAAVDLIESQGATIAGIAAIQIDDNQTTRELRSAYRCASVRQEAH